MRDAVLYPVGPDRERFTGYQQSVPCKVRHAVQQVTGGGTVILRQVQGVPFGQYPELRLVQYPVPHKKGGIGGIEVFLQRAVAPCVEVPVKYILRRFSYFKGKFLEGLHVEQAGGFDLGHLFKLLGQGQQLPVIGERLVMDVHITVFPDGEQAVDILVLRLSG